jgi:Uma2 family endonuclease
MFLRVTQVSPEEFDQFIQLPENADRNFELIAGEIVEKLVSGPRAAAIAAFIAGLLAVHVRQHDLGRVTGADGGYVVGSEKYIPDAAFISKTRQPVQPTDAYNPLAPDLAIEVLSPSNDDDEMRIKIANYTAAGSAVWVFDPDKRRIEKYKGLQPPVVLGEETTLEDEDLLPGFKIAVKELFQD